MTTGSLLDAATEAGYVLIPHGDRLRVRGPLPFPEQLVRELRRAKPALLAHLCAQQEQEREAAADVYWRQLQDIHTRAGCPRTDRWLTDRVRGAERDVEAAWLEARNEGTHAAHERALAALETWWRVAAESLREEGRLTLVTV